MTRISRRDALRVAADVLEQSDWLATDLLADEGDEHASENADRIVEILRELAAESVVCQDCGASGTPGNCPYAEGITGRKIPVVLCASCYRDRAMDV